MERMAPSIRYRRLLCSAMAAMCFGKTGAEEVTSQNINDAPTEAMQRQALSPFRAILNNANTPARPKAGSSPAPSTARPSGRQAAKQSATGTAESAVPARSTLSAAMASPPASAPNIAGPSDIAAAPADTVTPTTATPPHAAVPVLQPKLVAIRQDAPELPRSLQNMGAQGTVKVGFAVNEDGSTEDVRVLSSTNVRLNESAVKAVSKWQFQPIDRKGLAEIDFVFGSR